MADPSIAAGSTPPGAVVRVRFVPCPSVSCSACYGAGERAGVDLSFRIGQGDVSEALERYVSSMRCGQVGAIGLNVAGNVGPPSGGETLSHRVELLEFIPPVVPANLAPVAAGAKARGNAMYSKRKYGAAVRVPSPVQSMFKVRRRVRMMLLCAWQMHHYSRAINAEQHTAPEPNKTTRCAVDVCVSALNNTAMCGLVGGAYAKTQHHSNMVRARSPPSNTGDCCSGGNLGKLTLNINFRPVPQVLTLEPANVKALQRRAQAFKSMHAFGLARRDCEYILNRTGASAEEARKILRQIHKDERLERQAERDGFGTSLGTS